MVSIKWGSEPPSNRTALNFAYKGIKMVHFVDEIDYDDLTEKALRNVIYYALKIVEEQGLPGDNHFYITFHTDAPGVVVSKNLKIQYPETMTIVLQNQFSNLIVKPTCFSVDLHFGGVPQTITIPFDAITYFADPSCKFGLSFEQTPLEEFADEATQTAEPDVVQNAEVISIDKYRRK